MAPRYVLRACLALMLSFTYWFRLLMNLLGDRTRLGLGYDLRFRLNLGLNLVLYWWLYLGLGLYPWFRLCWELGRGLSLGLGHKLT